MLYYESLQTVIWQNLLKIVDLFSSITIYNGSPGQARGRRELTCFQAGAWDRET